jgi:hypothetical protein
MAIDLVWFEVDRRKLFSSPDLVCVNTGSSKFPRLQRLGQNRKKPLFNTSLSDEEVGGHAVVIARKHGDGGM